MLKSLNITEDLLGKRNGTLLTDVNTVEEFTDILPLHPGHLLDAGSGKGNSHNVVALKFKLILNISGLSKLHRRGALALERNTLTDEVTDFEDVAVNSSVDGEVIVHETHLVAETLGKTNLHVVDVGADGADRGELLALGEPHVDTESLAVINDLNIDVQVLEVTRKFTTGALHGDYAGLDGHGAVLVDIQIPSAQKGPHAKALYCRLGLGWSRSSCKQESCVVAATTQDSSLGRIYFLFCFLFDFYFIFPLILLIFFHFFSRIIFQFYQTRRRACR